MTKARDLADLLDASGNIIAQGTIDGRDIASDGSKLDSIEHGATGDQTHSEIRALITAGVDTNVFTDADHSKLDGIEAGATGDQTAAEIKTAYESNANTNEFSDAEQSKLAGIETGATADQTKSDIDALNVDADTLDGQHGSYYTSYADTAVANIVDSAPGTLDTLNELAAALGDDPNFATTTATNIGTKANKTITVSAGSGLTGGGDLTANRTISHADTSSQASLTALTGAAVVSGIDVDTYGHVTGLATRNLTLANLGYTGATNANNYSHPTHPGDDMSVDTGPLSGATVISDLDFNVTTDTLGHVTDANATVATRTLTLANLGYTGATNANYITNNNQLTNGAGYTTNVGDITGVTAGSGITGGGTSGTVTINHADTSSQASVDNSDGTVIQDITLDTYGHITGIASTNLDGRYYTETEADSRFVNVTGDTMTGNFTVPNLGIGTTSITDSNWGTGNTELAIEGGSGYGVIHLRGTGGGSVDTRYSIGVGDNIFYMAYDDVDGVHRAQINSSHQLILNEGSGNQRAFHDAYHPNADKWTTARTLSLSGDASGSVSWDGSANATLSVTVNNDSHSHTILKTSGNYVWNNSTTAGNYPTVDGAPGVQTSFVSNSEGFPNYGAVLHVGARGGTDAGGDFQIFCGHGSNYGGNYLRVRNADNEASPTDSWTSWRTIWDSGNDGSGSGLDADLLDGLQLHTGRNNEANRVVRTQGNGYAEFGWINTTSGDTSASLSRIYVDTGDGYIRKSTLAHVASQLPIDAGAPAGSIIYHAGSSAPSGYIKANGASLSTSTYSALFSAIGYTYGGSGGSFNVPDLRGEFIRGWDDSRGVDSGRGFGSFQSDDFGSHTHTAYGAYSSTWFAVYARSGSWGSERFITTNSYQTASTGGADTRPRNRALLACIKT